MFFFLQSVLTLTPFFDPKTLHYSENPSFKQPSTLQLPPKIKPDLDIAKLADLIGHVESDSVGGYNAANAGRAMDLGHDGLIKIFGRPCHEITIREVKALQRRGLLHAVGRYQIIPSTLRAAVKWAKVSEDDYFSPETQDRLLVALIQHKRPKVWQYIKTGNYLNTAVNELAKEWAGIPTTSGHSYYGWGNRAHTTVTKVKAVLQQIRLTYAFA